MGRGGTPDEVATVGVLLLSLPLEQAAEGYKAMDERRAIKTLLRT